MIHRLLPALILLMPVTGLAKGSPLAEVICDSTDRMRDRLEHQFGTRRQAMGLRGPEEVMEVWTDARGDWTMVVTYATGTSCIVAMGEDWQQTGQTNGRSDVHVGDGDPA
ncbi:MAG: hypothetical protein CML66_29610 [Rhodobacteraceae bacterium]|nr:hypothetical protein [Paracoccaceae bacterium]MAY47748.1 hypothetical protein [Paracoccaceae bacterium]|tara:strand:- start:62 stop:391 length:330 start_codon:yes stop_codon:yes gene_type:complete